MDLSVIILSYNTRDITSECLNKLQSSVISCQKKLGNKIEVIVLDNASTDGSSEMIKEKYISIDSRFRGNDVKIKLIESKENTGYSRGNNLALKKTSYPIVLFLNSDVYVEGDSLEKALVYFKNPNCDVLGPKLVFEDGKFQPSAGNLPTPLNTIFWILGISLIPIVGQFTNAFHPNYQSFFESPTVVPVGWVTGAFLMIRREVFENIEGFDEDIFMYLDEVDLCKRISDKGYKIWYAPNIQVVHLHGASSKFDSSLALLSELKGLKYYFSKYYPNWYGVVKFFLILGLVLRAVAFSLLGQTKKARVYVEGIGVV